MIIDAGPFPCAPLAGGGIPGDVIEVVHLSAGAEPPETGAWVCIRLRETGEFVVEIFEYRRRPVIKYDSGLQSFQTAIGCARQHADRIGVAMIYAIGCEQA